MDFYIGNTDWEWYSYLKALDPAPLDINFWKPSAASFAAVPIGAPFLLKLKKPYYKIAGVGFFMGYNKLPLSMAWETFGKGNGCESLPALARPILNYRKKMSIATVRDPEIGCIALSEPIFFDEKDWIDAPSDWASPIVSGKTYSTLSAIGGKIWEEVELRIELARQNARISNSGIVAQPNYGANEFDENPHWHGYGPAAAQKVRIGQASFRMLVTNAYANRCAVTGEPTITVLEAAHIQDYSQQGPHHVQNGLLLRADLHKLLDGGLMTVTPDHRIEIAQAIRDKVDNASDYIGLHGRYLSLLPRDSKQHPHKQFLSWHNENRFKG